jgi:HPt (histidine-containing phosphotransfer) domain-containing protein
VNAAWQAAWTTICRSLSLDASLSALLVKWSERDVSGGARSKDSAKGVASVTAVIGSRGGAPALDPAVLESLRNLSSDGGEALVAKLAHIFRDDALLRRDQLRRAFDESNAGLLRSAAHAFKSSSANMGARALAELCRQIETQTLGGGHTGVLREPARRAGARIRSRRPERFPVFWKTRRQWRTRMPLDPLVLIADDDPTLRLLSVEHARQRPVSHRAGLRWQGGRSNCSTGNAPTSCCWTSTCRE